MSASGFNPIKLLGSGLAAGGAYSVWETRRYTLETRRLEVPPSTPALRVLHLSDTHMRAGHRRLRAWLEALPGALGGLPDLVLATGDLVEENNGIEPLVAALGRLTSRLGCFYVLGSHDYYLARFQPHTKYFSRDRTPVKAPKADSARLERGLEAAGWRGLSNDSVVLESDVGRIRLTGVDDPYLKRHRTDHIERRAGEALAIGLMHSPDVVSEFILAGFDLVVAGHTHAGQVRIPGIGALVTNCSLPAPLAGGAHRIGNGWLHVSPGLGTGRFSPVRFNCLPEATVLELVPAAP
jgi:uncharacterized protein